MPLRGVKNMVTPVQVGTNFQSHTFLILITCVPGQPGNQFSLTPVGQYQALNAHRLLEPW